MKIADHIRRRAAQRRRKRLRVVLVMDDAYASNSTARSCLTQLNALANLGVGLQVSLVSLYRSADEVYHRNECDLPVTALIDGRNEKETPVDPSIPARLARHRSVLVPHAWRLDYSALADAAMRSHFETVQTDVIVTTSTPLLALVTQLAPPGVAIVHQEHRAQINEEKDTVLTELAPRADVVTTLTRSLAQRLVDKLGPSCPALFVIPNPLPTRQQPQSTLETKTFVSAGHLRGDRQFGNVINAFADLSETLPEWRLRIVGEGPHRDRLEGLIRRRQCEDRVELVGEVGGRSAEWAKAAVCVMSPREDYYPPVLQEAMSAGVPVVSYDCPYGPREILTHGVDGLLVAPGSTAALRSAMATVATDHELRHHMGAAALARSADWHAQTLAPSWLHALEVAFDRRATPHSKNPNLRGEDFQKIWSKGPKERNRSAEGITPAAARTEIMRVAALAAAATGSRWFVIPPHGRDESPVVVIPGPERDAFLDSLAEISVPRWMSVRDPENSGWRLHQGEVGVMARDLKQNRSPQIHLEPWPKKVGHQGLLTTGSSIAIQFWERTTDGRLVAPTSNRYGRILNASLDLEESEVEGVLVPVPPLMSRVTVEDCNFPIDAVYTWVDGSDEAWAARRDERLAALGREVSQRASGSVRYHNRDELKYSMRSLYLYAPWVRDIYVVTAGQCPAWLNADHPHVHLVDHREILPPESLPTFNSHAIETRLHTIENLSENFLYLNDDVFLGRPQKPVDYFTPSGQPRVFVSENQPIGVEASTTETAPHLVAAQNNRELLVERFGVISTHTLRHSPHPQNRALLEQMTEDFAEAISRTTASPFRSNADISMLSSLAQHYGLATGRAVRATGESSAFVTLGDHKIKPMLKALLNRENDFFCFGEHLVSAYDTDHVYELLADFLNRYYPIAAPWEKD